MEKSVSQTNAVELWCVSVLLGECAGVIYVLGSITMHVLDLW